MPDSPVRTVPLGSTGIEVTEFFFGGAAIGGIGSAPSRIGLGMKTDEALERLDEAYEVGVRVLDTANSFAGGESERVIGRWREERERADVLVSTKVGNVSRPRIRRAHAARRDDHRVRRRHRYRADPGLGVLHRISA